MFCAVLHILLQNLQVFQMAYTIFVLSVRYTYDILCDMGNQRARRLTLFSMEGLTLQTKERRDANDYIF